MDAEKNNLIRLLIVDEGLHNAEKIINALRSADAQVRAEHAEDEEDMIEILGRKALDIVVFSLDLPSISLKQAMVLIGDSGKHLSLIVMTRNEPQNHIVKLLNAGVKDVIHSENLEHLALVIRRESRNLTIWRQTNIVERELHESERRCHALLDSSRDAIAYLHEGMHIYANETYLELFGLADLGEMSGTPIMDIVHSSQQEELKTFLRQLNKNQNAGNELNLKLLHSSGETVEGLMEFSTANYEGELCTQIVIRSQSDTTDLEQQINYLHQHDLVTGLFNRQYFMEELKNTIDRAISGIQQSALLYISIDNFQSIRDSVGISGCDVLIGNVANLLQENANEKHFVARFGTHSYAVICYADAKSTVEELATSLPKLVENHISDIGNKSISSTCSVSVCFIDENSPHSANEILSRAEKTCENIQHTGGNKASTYIPAAGEMTQEEGDAQLAGIVKNAIKNNLITGMFQPIVSINGDHIERYQASLLIENESGQKLEKTDYIAAAERTGTAKSLDRWMILNAIKLVASTSKKSRKLEFYIPLSIDSLNDPSLTRWIANCINAARVPGEQLTFMINEIDAANHLKLVKTLFKGLKQLHCQFAIDEFGTGINPYQLIKHIKADYVRINHAYLEGLSKNTDNQDSIREIAQECSNAGIQTITPNVEDASVLSVLWTLNVDYVQGSFLQGARDDLNYDFSSI